MVNAPRQTIKGNLLALEAGVEKMVSRETHALAKPRVLLRQDRVQERERHFMVDDRHVIALPQQVRLVLSTIWVLDHHIECEDVRGLLHQDLGLAGSRQFQSREDAGRSGPDYHNVIGFGHDVAP